MALDPMRFVAPGRRRGVDRGSLPWAWLELEPAAHAGGFVRRLGAPATIVERGAVLRALVLAQGALSPAHGTLVL